MCVPISTMETALQCFFEVEPSIEPVFDDDFVVWSHVFVSLICGGVRIAGKLMESGLFNFVATREP